MTRSARRWLVALSFVGALVACGDPSSEFPDAGDAGPIDRTGTTSPRPLATPPPTSPAPEFEVTSVDGLEAPAVRATSHRFAAGRELDLDTVERLARTFELDGPVRRLDDAYGQRWLVGTARPDEPTLWVLESAPHSFRFSSPHVTIDTSGCDTSAWASTVPGEVTPGCEALAAPDLPDVAEAERRAAEIIATSGADETSYEFESLIQPGYRTIVQASLSGTLGAAVSWRFEFDDRAVPASVEGVVDEPTSTADIELVTLAEALARVRRDDADGWSFGDPMSLLATDPSAFPSTIAPYPNPVDGVVELVVVGVEIVSIERWDRDGSFVLLPAFRLTTTDGYERIVPAATDEVIETFANEPPASALLLDRAGLDGLVGLPLADFEEDALDLGYSTRVTERNGEPIAVNDDYRSNRANVAVDDDTVVAIFSIG